MSPQEIKRCRHSKENKLFVFGAIITILLLILLLAGSFAREEVITDLRSDMIAQHREQHPSVRDLDDGAVLKELSAEDKDLLSALDFYYWYVVLFAPVALFLLLLFVMGRHYGQLKANSVQINKHQYPEVQQLFADMARELGFETTPELYLVNGNGSLNAYATCVPGHRDFAAIYSDILERCLKNRDMHTLKFILGHELGHIKFNHVRWWYSALTIWMNLPVIKYFFGLPLSRARELGCDKISAALTNDTSGRALMMLSVGKYAYLDIDLDAYVREQFDKPSFWSWLSNLTNDHTVLAWRIAAIRKRHQAGLLFRNKH
ncbi:hypothetical protein CR983_02495 [Candidatus Saccharibacteria bacterium]|nr:MAG: hypothetical protein CR983_02495 [Candidatus Saccharibacteria bacterium]